MSSCSPGICNCSRNQAAPVGILLHLAPPGASGRRRVWQFDAAAGQSRKRKEGQSMRKTLVVSMLSILLAVLSFSVMATADVLYTYGATAVIPTPGSPPPPPEPTVWQFTSDPNGIGYAGLELQITGSLTPATLTTLMAEYLMTQGTFGGGAPRFTLFDGVFNSAR